MATVSGDPSHPLAVGSWSSDGSAATKSERYLAKRLAAAGADYKGVALTTFILAAAVIGLAWLGVGVLAEHWIVPRGLPRWVRWTWLGVGGVALAAGVVHWIVPLIRCRVNLVYAARSIEREYPDLHNDLVNAVLMKSDGDATSERMVRSLKRRAARWLSGVPADEAVVDRTAAVRLACAVAVLVGLACLYELLAPKSLLTTAARLMAPWTSVVAPSRVHISPIRLRWRMPEEGGGVDPATGHDITIESATATLVRGRQLIVVAGLRGMREGEIPTLTIRPLREDGSADMSAAAWQVAMERHRGGEGHGFTAVIPDASRGVDHSLELSLAAGDAQIEPVKVIVIDAPSLIVREVRYDYPAYTRQPAEVVRWQGDIRAIDGTKVTIVAAGNRPIGSAWLDFDCDERRDKPLKVLASDPTQASVTFDLHANVNGGAVDHRSYGLLFEPRDAVPGGSNGLRADPLQHRIDIVADVAPEITIEEPRESPLRVPPDAPVRVRVRAVDPDFGLARVSIETRIKNGGGAPKEIVLLSKEKSGPFEASAMIVPRQMGVAGGGTLEYRGVAVDTRPNSLNVTRTEWRALIIDPSAAPREPRQAPGEKERDPNGPPKDGTSGIRDSNGRHQDDRGNQSPDRQQGSQLGEADGNPETNPKNASDQSRSDQKGGDATRGDQQNGATAGDAPGGGKESGGAGSGGEKSGGGENAAERGGDGQRGGAQSGTDLAQPGKNGAQTKAGGKQQQRESVAADGTNDGEAMERILEHRRQQSGQKKDGQSGASSGNRQGPQRQTADGERVGQEGSPSPGGNTRTKSGPSQERENDRSSADSPGERDSGERRPEESRTSGTKSTDAVGQGDDANQGDGKGRDRQGGGQQGGGQQGGGQQGGGQQGGGQQGGGQQGGGQQGGGQQGGGQQGGGQQGGGQQTGGQQGSDGDGGEHTTDPSQKDAARGGSPSDARRAGDGTGEVQNGSRQGAPGAGEEGAAGQGQGDGAPGQAVQGAPGGGERTGSGAVGGGDGAQRADADEPDEARDKKELQWGEEDVAHARNAADLAVEHLRDSIEAGRSDVLRELGWTPEQARAFIERWRAMRTLADSSDPRKRGEFERAVRSLGLRSGGVRSSRDVPSDMKGGQAEGRRSRPPSEYREHVRAYLQGTSGE